MTPVLQESMCNKSKMVDRQSPIKVVVSGMSGLYPQSSNIKEFANILYKKVDPISRNPKILNRYRHPEVPNFLGELPHLEKFDAQFFKINRRLGLCMDPVSRKLFEHTYQALYDAGLSVKHVAGKNIGVFVGSSLSESEKSFYYNVDYANASTITGFSKAMYSNRISYWLDVKGPSLTVDEMCCSSINALEQAYFALQRGDCEAAIVASCSATIHPQTLISYGKNIYLSMDGTTSSFDNDARGCVKSAGVNVLFLQKEEDALRMYAEVVYAKTAFSAQNTDTKNKIIFHRSTEQLTTFLQKFYKETIVSPHEIDFVEAFGLATPDVDKAELEAFDNVFCKERNHKNPLVVGSVMSNIGYCEAASGIASIQKVLLAYETGLVAGNLNYVNPRSDVPAIREGRIQVLAEHKPTPSSYIAVNNLSISGVNGHVLLRGQHKVKVPGRYKSSIPHLIGVSGRQESCVTKIFEDLESRSIDPEELALLRHVHEHEITGHLARGFSIIDADNSNETVSISKRVEYFDDTKRPVWFVYSGMGSQWAGMGAQLMRIPIFAAAIERCKKVLEPKGLDIVHIISSTDKSIFDNILHSFVGIAAIQIGLTDILRELEIVPDNIIGHSVGELGCAYADGCLTDEQMILAAYSRGLVSLHTPFIKGSMAAVGIGYKKVIEVCPPEIDVACHNGPESSTISGPADIMQQFVSQLTAQGIFAKEVPCSNIAYHSRYIAEAGPKLLQYLNEIITKPKRRTNRWLSTSVPQDKWNNENAQYCSAWYHTNNLLSPVLFEETSKAVPPNAVVIEVAPHGLLQAILKRSLSPNCRHVPLTQRRHPDNTVFLLEAVGKLFLEGLTPKISVLYPKIEFPVSNGTPMLSHLVEWIHTETWGLPLYQDQNIKMSSIYNSVISIHEDEHKYLQGHAVNGKALYPFSAALVTVWDTLAMYSGTTKKQLSVQFQDVHLFAEPPILDLRTLKVSVDLHKGDGKFEVTSSFSRILTGFIKTIKSGESQLLIDPLEKNTEMIYDRNYVYNLLEERNYTFSDEFQTIKESNHDFTKAELEWNDNWVTFIDGLLQLSIVNRGHDAVSRPTHIHKITIDHQVHSQIQEVEGKHGTLAAELATVPKNYIRSGGVIIERIKFYDLPQHPDNNMSLVGLSFIPKTRNGLTELKSSFQVYLQIVSENLGRQNLKLVEIVESSNTKICNIDKAVTGVPDLSVNYVTINKHVLDQELNCLEADIVLVQNLSKHESIFARLGPNSYIINKETNINNTQLPSTDDYHIICDHSSNKERLQLGKWKPVHDGSPFTTIIIKDRMDLEELYNRKTLPNNKLLILTQYGTMQSLKKYILRYRKASCRDDIYLVLYSGNANIDDLDVSSLKLDLVFNILQNGVLGGEYYVHCLEDTAAECEIALTSGVVGDLNSLHWEQVSGPTSVEPSHSRISLQVRYFSVNYIDAKKASGMISLKTNFSKKLSYGMDFSGTTARGNPVMGIVESGAASGRVEAVPELVWPVPRHWSLEDAATVPLAYAQAFYCLALKADLHPGMSVLVHGATGALGLAVISIALAHQCQVFATVSSIRKKNFLLKCFPDLEGYVQNSRDHTFADLVLHSTKGQGCDIIVSCVTGHLKNTTLKCLGFNGILLDTIQAHVEDNYTYGMFHLANQTSYDIVNFNDIFKNEAVMKCLQSMIGEGISRGFVRPLPRVTYAASQSSSAFRLVAASRHLGRVLVHIGDRNILARPRMTCSSNMYQLVICHKNEFGLHLINRLVARGARNLLLVCSSLSDHSIKKQKRLLQKLGVNLTITSSEIMRSEKSFEKVGEIIDTRCIEGMFVVDVDDGAALVLESLISVARNYCQSLKYFAFISTPKVLDQLSEKWQLQMPLLKLIAISQLNHGISTSTLATLDALEQAILSSKRMLNIHPQKRLQSTLLQQIADISGITIPDSVTEDRKLKELGFDSTLSQRVLTFMENVHNASLVDTKVSEFTVKYIKDLEDTLNEPSFEKKSGLAAYLSYIDPDEIEASSEFVILPTLDKEGTLKKLHSEKQYLYIVPGLEGNNSRFKNMCQQLKLPAVVLQPGYDHPRDSVQHIALRYAQVLKKKTFLKDNFFIMGFESGISIALEVAAILENHGLVGTVFCVGGTPKEFKDSFMKNMQEYKTELDLQDAFLFHVATLILGKQGIDIRVKIKSFSSWDQKCDFLINYVLNRQSHTIQFIQSYIDATYNRIKEVSKSDSPTRQLKSKVVLIRTVTTAKLGTEEELQHHSSQPVSEYNLRVPLEHAMQDPRCAAIVNRHLPADILLQFQTKSQCEMYVDVGEVFATNSN